MRRGRCAGGWSGGGLEQDAEPGQEPAAGGADAAGREAELVGDLGVGDRRAGHEQFQELVPAAGRAGHGLAGTRSGAGQKAGCSGKDSGYPAARHVRGLGRAPLPPPAMDMTHPFVQVPQPTLPALTPAFRPVGEWVPCLDAARLANPP